jgi:hypothetical protein
MRELLRSSLHRGADRIDYDLRSDAGKTIMMGVPLMPWRLLAR